MQVIDAVIQHAWRYRRRLRGRGSAENRSSQARHDYKTRPVPRLASVVERYSPRKAVQEVLLHCIHCCTTFIDSTCQYKICPFCFKTLGLGRASQDRGGAGTEPINDLLRDHSNEYWGKMLYLKNPRNFPSQPAQIRSPVKQTFVTSTARAVAPVCLWISLDFAKL